MAGLSAAAAAAATWLGRVAAAAGEPAGKSPPNFVVIFIDDMGYGDIEPYGSKVNRTPNLVRMAAEGMKLTSFYAAPVCTPSRAQMMTGCYAKRVSLPNVIGPSAAVGVSAEERTVAQLLKARGYATMCIGKWHLGDQPEFLPTRHGFDKYLGLPYSNDMGAKVPLPLVRDEKVIEAPAEQDRLVALYTDEAVKFISASKDKPFFLYFPHTAVHVPIHPGKAFEGKSANGRFGDWVEEVDWSVGRVLGTLRELKLDSRTLVLFTSDNGPWLIKGKDAGVAGPLRGGKGSTWEGGMREPTIAWWPGKIAAGTACDAPVSEIDVLPTLVKLAGGEVPAARLIDGKDIWPLLAGQSKESPHEALFYFKGNQLEAVRSGPWKLAIVNQGGGAGAAKAKAKEKGKDAPAEAPHPFTPALYNLDTDIGETTDVAAQHPEVVKRLQEYVARMDADLGVKGAGPGVRPCGRVANPKPLEMVRVAMEYD
ncbi:MAG: sulfatase [Planctomycetes bacterium]|nr:sulfatase [Planctomycetota bacterium]